MGRFAVRFRQESSDKHTDKQTDTTKRISLSFAVDNNRVGVRLSNMKNKYHICLVQNPAIHSGEDFET